MSIRATTMVWDRSRAKGSNLMMLLAIADYAKDDGRYAWPSPQTLAFKTRLTGRAAELIVTKLVEDGEIAPELADDGRLYLHVRCVFDWTAYQSEGPIPEREKISRNVKRIFAQKLCRLAADFCRDAAAYAKNSANAGTASLLIRQEPSVNPSVDPSEEKAGASPRPAPAPENPDDNIGVITKLAHELLTTLGPPRSGEDADFTEQLKSRCAEARIAYNSAVVRKAFDSAVWQRTHGANA